MIENVKNIDYHIIDRCNLNCACCNHFSPLVPSTDNGKSIEQITADLALLSKIQEGFECLTILGGEPTLHPQLSKILRIARQTLPNKNINLVTNGTTYDKFERWRDSVIENEIFVVVSLYPYCSDSRERADKIRKILEPYDKFVVEHSADNKGFNYGFLSNKDNVATDYDIQRCVRPDWYTQVRNGKLYICNFAAQFDRLKAYFGDKIGFDLDGKEYLDLNGDVTLKDFYDFVNYAHPNICYRCLDCVNRNANGPRQPWSVTKKDINEWVVE